MNALIPYRSPEEKNTNRADLVLLKNALLGIRRSLMSSVDTSDAFFSKEEIYTEAIYLINNLIHFVDSSSGKLSFEDWETIEYSIDIINSNLEAIGGTIAHLKINLMLGDDAGEQDMRYHEVRAIEKPKHTILSLKERYDALEGVVFSEKGFSSIQAQDRVLEKFQEIIQGDAANQGDIGKIQSDINSLQHMYRDFDPRWDSREELLGDIMTADITKNADLAQRISMFIRVRSAEKRNYTATQEASPMFERHMDNLRERHPIIINTLEYGNVAITHIKKMYYEGAKGEYYKVRTQDKNGVKKDILLRTDNAVVGDLSRKYLGEFDSQGKLVSTNNTFTILSIQSDKIQHKRVEPTLTHKVSKTLSSIKNSVLGMFKKKE